MQLAATAAQSPRPSALRAVRTRLAGALAPLKSLEIGQAERLRGQLEQRGIARRGIVRRGRRRGRRRAVATRGGRDQHERRDPQCHRRDFIRHSEGLSPGKRPLSQRFRRVMNRRPCLPVVSTLLAAFGCQAKPDAPAQAPLPAGVIVHDAARHHDRRAAARPPLPRDDRTGRADRRRSTAGRAGRRHALDAATTGSNGTTLSRDSETIARVFPVGDPTRRRGARSSRRRARRAIRVSGDDATVADAAGQTVRRLHAKVGGRDRQRSAALATATGTTDLVLAALLCPRRS